METQRIAINIDAPDMEALGQAARRIEAGALVAFPTETVYGIACRVSDQVLARLTGLKGRASEKRFTLHIGAKADLVRYVPHLNLKARKLVAQAWPGPLTIVFDVPDPAQAGLTDSLGPEVCAQLYQDGTLGVRCPDHAVAGALLRLTRCPVVASSANLTGQPPAVTAGQALEALAGRVEMVLDAGPCPLRQSSTVARVGDRGVEVLRQGIIEAASLDRMTRVGILFVCTGNTCRSAMAEALCRAILAERLCLKQVDDLTEMGYIVRSAGTMGLVGAPASDGATAACAGRGIDLTDHRSSGLSNALIHDSDLIFVMTRSHRDQVLSFWPDRADQCMLLDARGDIADPVGQSETVFKACCEQIDKAIRNRISECVL